VDAVLAVVISPACVACGSSLDRPLDGPVCDACWIAIHPIQPPLCDVCGDPLTPVQARAARGQSGNAGWTSSPSSDESGGPPGPAGSRSKCDRCRHDTREVDRGRAVGSYAGVLREAIHAFKYDGRRSIGRRLGDLMREYGREMIDGADFAVPVPLHPSRQHKRGFNQARDLAARLGLPVRPFVRRRRATRPQVDLPAAERHRNLANAFVLRRYVRTGRWRWRRVGRVLEGAVVVLVDDVSTTGATLDACARVLKAGGAREVRALTAARTVRKG
jgi:ComF family protein